MDFGSWDSLLLIVAAVIILLAAAQGWRRGIIRQAANILALVLAWLAAFWGGALLAPWLRFLRLPDFAIMAIASVVLGLLVYFGVQIVAGILFKKTGEQSVGLVRWGYGAGGALLGLAYGCFTVFILFIGIRLLGTVAEADQQLTKMRQAGPRRDPGMLLNNLAEMKRAIDHGPVGPMMAQADPMPTQVYRVLGKLTRVLGNERAARRFFDFPGAAELSRDPKIEALRNDPEIVKSAQRKDFFSLLRNPHIMDAANDPKLRKMIGEFQLEQALDYSLEEKPAGLQRAPLQGASSPDSPELFRRW